MKEPDLSKRPAQSKPGQLSKLYARDRGNQNVFGIPADENMVTFGGGKWHEKTAEPIGEQTTFADIKFYYANIIDYGRIALSFLGCVSMYYGHPLLTFVLCSSSFLLDYVDGIVARKYNQCR
jgi:hypothetical protein